MEPDSDLVAASCHVLEFSVSPGGARQGDLHGALDVARLRARFEDRYDTDHLAYLVLWYGAFLHLWTVQAGKLTAGVDLHPHLRTGDPSLDRAASALLASGRPSELRDLFNKIHLLTDETMTALRVLAHVLDLREHAPDDLAAALAGIDRRTLPDLPPIAATYELDWSAVAATAEPLRDPLLRPHETTAVTWSQDGLAPPWDSYLRHVDGVILGLVDLEGGDEEWDDA
ncbi:hypothetical protein [Dactylosporangium sp. CS-033363]|uniref:hypothetical protein n=1 Tax=Dactylosporangium sp. CS-033363 TaxID=3239935 RepID=UPI003D949215